MAKITVHSIFFGFIPFFFFFALISCGDNSAGKKGVAFLQKMDSAITGENPDLDS